MATNKDNAMNMTDATPEQQAVKSAGGFGFLQVISRFLREVLVELKKTNWPSKNDLTKFVIVVMFTIIIVSIYLFISDTLVGLIAERLFGTGVGR